MLFFLRWHRRKQRTTSTRSRRAATKKTAVKLQRAAFAALGNRRGRAHASAISAIEFSVFYKVAVQKVVASFIAAAPTRRGSQAGGVTGLHKTINHSALFENFNNFLFRGFARTALSLTQLSSSEYSATQLISARATRKTRGPRLITSASFIDAFGAKPLSLLRKRPLTVKFKPGYPRFFRKLRHDYITSHGLRFKYQHRLTTYLRRYRNLSNGAILNSAALSAVTMLVALKLASDGADAMRLVAGGIVFINGTQLRAGSVQLQVGDILQLRVTGGTYRGLLTKLLLQRAAAWRIAARLYRLKKSLISLESRRGSTQLRRDFIKPHLIRRGGLIQAY